MFDPQPDEALQLLVETARSFAGEEIAPRLRESEAARGVAAELGKSFVEIGFAGLELPESCGGAGLGSVARVLVNEELAAADAGAALALDPLGPALYPLLELGGEEAVREHALPLSEGAGGRAVLVSSLDARLELDRDRVSGVVPWVPADRVDLLVILSESEAVVVREAIGTRELRGAGLRAAGASELHLDRAPIVGRWRDEAAAGRALARARLYLASLLLGVLREAAEFSRRYALERQAFGRPIAHHQALAFLIADMHMAVEGARGLVQDAAWRSEAGGEAGPAAASAYAEVIEASALVGPSGVQILGGHGFMADYPVEKMMRESRALGLLLGGLDAAREEAGCALVEQPGPVALSHGERV